MEIEDIRYCPHCGKRLTKSTVEGYSWQCKDCDEDFYDFEALTIRFVLDQCLKELKDNLKKKYVDAIVDCWGTFGIAYESLERMHFSGKYKYPTAYKYRKDLTLYVKLCIKDSAKRWVRKR